MKMILIAIVFVVFALFLLQKKLRLTFFRKKQAIWNIRTWMQMTREERYRSDQEVKKKSMLRRKSLINDIRREYKDLSE